MLCGVNKISLRSKRWRTNSPTRKVLWSCRKWEDGACCLLAGQCRQGSGKIMEEMALHAPWKWRQGARGPQGLCWKNGYLPLTCLHKGFSDQTPCPEFLALGKFLQLWHKFHGRRRTLQKTGVKVSCLSEGTEAPNKTYDELQKTKELFPPHLQCIPNQGGWEDTILLEPAQSHVTMHHSSWSVQELLCSLLPFLSSS